MGPFLERLKAGEILVADGATGTNLQVRGLTSGTPAEVWVLEKPDEIVGLHRSFIEAGSDIILTCTFGGTSIRLENAGLAGRAAELNHAAVQLARRAVEQAARPVLIAGSLGPVGHLLKPFGLLEPEDASNAYREQAQALTEAGVDLLVIETQFDLTEAQMAIEGVRAVSELPLICSFSFDRGTRTMMGVKPAQIGQLLPELGVNAIGINCGRSLDDNLKALQELRSVTDLPIWFKPNAGLPELDEEGHPVYSLTPELMGARVCDWLEAGANIVGGCCGTSAEHLRQIALAAKKPARNA